MVPSACAVGRAIRAQESATLNPLVRIDQLWGLARAWYSTRLDAAARRPGPDEMRRIFAGLGLAGDFWDPQSDRFG